MRIGRIELDVDEAVDIVHEYTTPRTAKRAGRRKQYAWQAYDLYDIHENGTTAALTDGDLLAPVLLNVNLGIGGFISLRNARSALERAVARIDNVDLSAADDAQIVTAARAFSILSTEEMYDVKLTTLAKVLHRKRPRMIPLYDAFVEKSYLGHRVPRAKDRRWSTTSRPSCTRCKPICVTPIGRP